MDTQARMLAVRERRDTVVSLLEPARHAGPPCVQCRYFAPGFEPSRCASPAYSDHSVDFVAGVVAESPVVSAATARAHDGLCGPEALLFDPKTVAQRVIPPVVYIGGTVFAGAMVLLGLQALGAF